MTETEWEFAIMDGIFTTSWNNYYWTTDERDSANAYTWRVTGITPPGQWHFSYRAKGSMYLRYVVLD